MIFKIYYQDGTFKETSRYKVEGELMKVKGKYLTMPSEIYLSKYKKHFLIHLYDDGSKIYKPILPPNLVEGSILQTVEEKNAWATNERRTLKKRFLMENWLDRNMDSLMIFLALITVGLVCWFFVKDAAPGMNMLDNAMKLALKNCRVV